CLLAYQKVLAAIADAEREDKALQHLDYPGQLDRESVADLKERVKIATRMLQANRDRDAP
ncbi:MAG TPA: hypothetical protein VHF22_04310, partial [Planctomycetota bacterium]|nr:hypothetical protein [Planctomycetota bacterium]